MMKDQSVVALEVVEQVQTKEPLSLRLHSPELLDPGDLDSSSDFTLRASIKDEYEAGVRDFQGRDWSGQVLAELDLSGVDLRGTNLFRTNLRGTNLAGADLRGCNCNQTNFRYGNLLRTNLSNLNFLNCRFEYARISHAVVVGSTFTNANFIKTLWNFNRIACDRFSPYGIRLTGDMNESQIELACEKTENRRKITILSILMLILYIFLHFTSI